MRAYLVSGPDAYGAGCCALGLETLQRAPQQASQPLLLQNPTCLSVSRSRTQMSRVRVFSQVLRSNAIHQQCMDVARRRTHPGTLPGLASSPNTTGAWQLSSHSTSSG